MQVVKLKILFFGAFLCLIPFSNHAQTPRQLDSIAEVEELLPAGSLDPNEIHTPGIFVQRIFQGKEFEKRIEQRTVRKRD